MKAFKYSDVANIFETYPESIRSKLLFLRQLIFDLQQDWDIWHAMRGDKAAAIADQVPLSRAA